jgi:hypothetical protein
MLPATITVDQDSDSQLMIHDLISGDLQILLSIPCILYTSPMTTEKKYGSE